MTEHEGRFSIPTRLLLTNEQRMKLEQLVRSEGLDLADIVSQIVAEYLEPLPASQAPAAPTDAERQAELRHRRAELARLRARRNSAGDAAPAWLDSYIAELEAELLR